jgi:hypothetical protein
MDSSCELLSSLDPAWGSVHCCEVPCRTLEASASIKGVTFRDVLLGLASLRGLSEKTREAHRWVWVNVKARRALLTPTCTVKERVLKEDLKERVLNCVG